MMTGMNEEVYQTPYKPQHKLGGRQPERGMKYFGCFVANTCNDFGKDNFYEPITDY